MVYSADRKIKIEWDRNKTIRRFVYTHSMKFKTYARYGCVICHFTYIYIPYIYTNLCSFAHSIHWAIYRPSFNCMELSSRCFDCVSVCVIILLVYRVCCRYFFGLLFFFRCSYNRFGKHTTTQRRRWQRAALQKKITKWKNHTTTVDLVVEKSLKYFWFFMECTHIFLEHWMQ